MPGTSKKTKRETGLPPVSSVAANDLVEGQVIDGFLVMGNVRIPLAALMIAMQAERSASRGAPDGIGDGRVWGDDGPLGNTPRRRVAHAAEKPREFRPGGSADDGGDSTGEGATAGLDVGDVGAVAPAKDREILLSSPGPLSGDPHPLPDDRVGIGGVLVHVSNVNRDPDSRQGPTVDIIMGKNVRARRRDIGMTQGDLSEAMKVHRTRIAQLEGGDTWALAQAASAAAALRCTVGELIGEAAPQGESRAISGEEWAIIEARRAGDLVSAMNALMTEGRKG